MTPEEYRKLEEQVGTDDAKRLVLAQRVCEALKELEKHLKSQHRNGDT